MSRWESQARQTERELLEKTSRAESLRRQLEEARWRQGETEQRLALRLRECEEELARQAAAPPRVKVRGRGLNLLAQRPSRTVSELRVFQYVTHTVGAESAGAHKAVAELQAKNAGLQEQLSAQTQLLRELETQLHESQRSCAQLRTQVTAVCPSPAQFLLLLAD